MKVSPTYHKYKRVLVAGGAGFLGSHLCERLISQGHEVFCLDNFHTGRRENVDDLLRNPQFHLIHHDIVLPYYVHVDEVFNLACPASPVHYAFDPIHTIKTSVGGVLNLLGLAKRTRAKILHASTSEVYGDPLQHPQTENYWGNVNSYGPRACYDEGKRCAEALLYSYREQHDLDARICRIFNTYGPRMHQNDGRVVSNFVVQALTGEPITIYGDGSQTRSFCFVDDLIDGMLALMNCPENVGSPVNLGNPEEYTVLQLAEAVCDLTGTRAQLAFKPLPTDDPTRRRPDIGVARTKLGWHPKTKLHEGLWRTIDYFDDTLTSSGRKAASSARISHIFSHGTALNVVGSAR
jgi:UDP-glucuronate decarboxylase